MFRKTVLLSLIMVFFYTTAAFGTTSITFTLANGQITGTDPMYYEFDVMAAAGEAGTRIGDCMAYINYNTEYFGSWVKSNGKITVSAGTLTQGILYSLMVNDNTASRVAITAQYIKREQPELANELPTTPTRWVHVILEIADPSKTAGLSFEESLMSGNEYKSNNSTKYDPVIATDALTVPMAFFVIDYAKIDFKKKPDDDKVRVQGRLELDLVRGDGVDISEDVTVTVGPLSETITMVEKGKKIERWEYKRPKGGTGDIKNMTIELFEPITMVEKGKKGEKWEYKRPKGGTGDIKNMTIDWKKGKFDIRMDKADLTEVTNPVTISVQVGNDVGSESILMRKNKHHWDYKRKSHGSIVAVPMSSQEKDYALYANYPNPFNPETWIPYQLASDAQVIIRIYNVHGNLIRTMDLGNKATGVYISKDKAAYWDGKNNTGEHVASGVYFYQLQVRPDIIGTIPSIGAGEFAAMRKMIIIK